jgi:hypothetical protein
MLADWIPGWLGQGGGVILAVGLAVCGLALVVGRKLTGSGRQESQALGEAEAEALDGLTRDRRAAPRRKGNTVEVQILAGGSEEPVTAWVLDRSVGGLCLLAEHPLPEGVPVKVRPRKQSGQAPWTDVTVKSCRREGSQYELGCQFHRTPSWNLLLQFG